MVHPSMLIFAIVILLKWCGLESESPSSPSPSPSSSWSLHWVERERKSGAQDQQEAGTHPLSGYPYRVQRASYPVPRPVLTPATPPEGDPCDPCDPCDPTERDSLL